MIDSVFSLLETLGVHGLRWLWVPALLWSLLAVPVHVLSRVLGRWDARIPYWMHRAVWWALPAGLLLSTTGLVRQLLVGVAPGGSATTSGGPAVWIGLPSVSGTSAGADSTGSLLLAGAGLLTVAALVAALYHLARLAHGTGRLRLLRAHGSVRTEVSRTSWEIAERVGVRRPVEVLVVEEATVPMTFGWWAPVVVMPLDLVDREEELRLALTHELVHIRRGDYRESWMEELFHVPFAGFPLAGWFRRRLAFFREIACDTELLERFGVNRRSYAQLLLRIADLNTEGGAHALAMGDSTSRLKDRIEAMIDGERGLPDFVSPRMLGAGLGGLLLLAGTLVVACSEMAGPRLETGSAVVAEEGSPGSAGAPPPPQMRGRSEGAGADVRRDEGPPPPPEPNRDPEVFVAVEQMPELIGGIRGLQQQITYPEGARRSGAEGRVIVTFEVSREGEVDDAEVLKGVSDPLDAEALRVVREAEFRPGRQRGEPVRVKLSLPVTFRLDENASEVRDVEDPSSEVGGSG